MAIKKMDREYDEEFEKWFINFTNKSDHLDSKWMYQECWKAAINSTNTQVTEHEESASKPFSTGRTLHRCPDCSYEHPVFNDFSGEAAEASKICPNCSSKMVPV